MRRSMFGLHPGSAVGQVREESANNRSETQPSNTRDEQCITPRRRAQAVMEHGLPGWALSRRGFGVLLLASAAAVACGSPNERPESPSGGYAGGGTGPASPEAQPTPPEWKIDPGEVTGKSPEEVVTSWTDRFQWALNNPESINADGETGAQIMRDLFAKTTSGDAWYNSYTNQAQAILQRRQPRMGEAGVESMPDEMFRDVTTTALQPPQIIARSNETPADFAGVQQFSQVLRLDQQWLWPGFDLGANATAGSEPLVARFSFGRFDVGRGDGTTKETLWQVYEINGDVTS